LPVALGSLAAALPDRPVAVCRELTKLHEEVRRGSAAELSAHFGARRAGAPLRGEVVLVLGAPAEQPTRRPEALQALAELVRAGARARPAAAAVAKLSGLPANELYREFVRSGAQPGAGARR